MKHKVLELRPTQMALGMREVEHRVKKIRAFSHHERDAHLHERHVPVVKGPHSRHYIIDRHHLVRACWEAGIEEIPIEIKEDFSHLSSQDLFQVLHQSRWVYPFDQFGHGPHDPIHLPENIRGLADDPFRSLAWMVRDKGGFDKVTTPFAEFHWANYFRKELKHHPIEFDFDRALDEAMKLCKEDRAARLPGFKK